MASFGSRLPPKPRFAAWREMARSPKQEAFASEDFSERHLYDGSDHHASPCASVKVKGTIYSTCHLTRLSRTV